MYAILSDVKLSMKTKDTKLVLFINLVVAKC